MEHNVDCNTMLQFKVYVCWFNDLYYSGMLISFFVNSNYIICINGRIFALNVKLCTNIHCTLYKHQQQDTHYDHWTKAKL